MKCPTCGQAMLTEWPHDHGPVSERKAASGHVEAARAALLDRLQPLLAGEHYEAVRAMMAFEAAIRAEAVGALDVERLAEAMRVIEATRSPGAYPHLGQDNDLRRFANDLADHYAVSSRLAEDAE